MEINSVINLKIILLLLKIELKKFVETEEEEEVESVKNILTE
jgi:hypothetical protein